MTKVLGSKLVTVEEVIHTVAVTRDKPDKPADAAIVERVIDKAEHLGGITPEAAKEVVKHIQPAEPYSKLLVDVLTPSSER